MPSWLNFATISGAVTILAFIAECLKAFPKYTEFRRGFLLVSLGFFVGSLLTATSGAQILLSTDGSPLVLLMIICLSLVLLFLFLAVMASREARKYEFYGLMAVFIAGFLLFMLIYGSTGGTYAKGIGDLTFAETVSIAELAMDSGNYDRAIEFWDAASSGLDMTDPRLVVLKRKIETAKKRQLEKDMSVVN